MYYGDLINGICYTAFLPVYFYLWLQEKDLGRRSAASSVVAAFAWTAAFSWLSYFLKKPNLSVMALMGMSSSIYYMNIHQWPHADELVVLPQFLWSLLILSANRPLTFPFQFALAMVALLTAVYVAAKESSQAVLDTLPVLGGATSMHIWFHYYATYLRKKSHGFVSAHVASLVLAGSFAYHASSEIVTMYRSPGYGSQGGYSILRAGFFALVGLAAAGSFQLEMDSKEALERLVDERARELTKQAAHLRVLEHALQASETAIAIVDVSQKVLWSNSSLQELVAVSPVKLQDSNLFKALQYPDDEVVQSFPPVHAITEEIVLRKRHMSVEMTPFPADAKKNNENRYLVALKDMTSQRARERAEKAAEREALIAQTMNESMQNLSHELRTPLQGIMGMASLVLDEPGLPPDVTESMSMVIASARLLLTLINNMLDVRKCDASMLDEFQLTPFRLVSSLEDAITFCKPFAITSEVKLDLEINDDEMEVESNDLRFQQIMINLLSNAIKHSCSGDQVIIRASSMELSEAEQLVDRALVIAPGEPSSKAFRKEDGPVAVVTVTDQGPGIPFDQRMRVFGRFSQLTENVQNAIIGSKVGQPSGTGLGLNLCMKFVHRMNGRIWVTNNPEKGCSFSFYVHRVLLYDRMREVSLPRTWSQSIHQVLRPVPRIPLTKEFRIVLVDDTLINLKVLSRMLSRLGVQKMATANNGKEALDLLTTEDDFNLVLTDIQMPEMTGIELSLAIRKLPLKRQPLIVGLTADTSDAGDARCTQSGMATILRKPITTNQLHHFLQEVEVE
jgi:signal transduction histidine kinase